MFNEFKTFITRGNVVDLAIGVIIGAAFGKIIASLVDDILMPPIGLLQGGVDFRNLFWTLGPLNFATLDEAQKAGAATINYGLFLGNIVHFLIVAFMIFLVVKQLNRYQRPAPATSGPDMKKCSFCHSSIDAAATRCAHCTSQLGEG